MTRVLQLIETGGPGGAERMLISLVEGLDRERFRSLVGLRKEGWLRAELERRGVETVIVPQARRVDIRWLTAMADLCRRRKIGLVHSHEFAMNVHGALLAALVGLLAVATVHGKNYYAARLRRRIAYRLMARRSVCVAVSEEVRRYLNLSVGIPRERVRLIHNGISWDTFAANGARRSATRADLGLRPEQIAIGAIGSHYPVKGHAILLRAMPHVLSIEPRAVLIMAGRGPLRAALEEEAVRLGIGGQVTFLGFRDDVAALLDAFDLFVLPSLSEGLPLSLLEAMANGKAVVASRVGGVPEVVEEGRSGLLVPAGEADALAIALLRLIQDRPLARILGARASERVRSSFGIERMVNSYEDLYRNLLDGRTSTASAKVRAA